MCSLNCTAISFFLKWLYDSVHKYICVSTKMFQITLPCLGVNVKFQFVSTPKSKMDSQLLLASTSSHVQLLRGSEKAFNVCLRVRRSKLWLVTKGHLYGSTVFLLVFFAWFSLLHSSCINWKGSTIYSVVIL